jgi:succinate-acetate transporter protein
MALTEQAQAPANGQVPEARVFLQPIAAPSVLGYFGLSSGLIIFGTWLAGAWGSAASSPGFFEFILVFAGFGQLAAALWSYRARDAVAASIHGAWGAFFTGFGFYWLTTALGTVASPALGTMNQPAGQWFIYMAVITWTTAFAALARGPGLFGTHAVLGTGALIAAVSLITGAAGWQQGAGWVFVAAAALAACQGTALMINSMFGLTILPLFTWRRDENLPGGHPVRPLEFAEGEPGVKAGQ